MAGNGNGTPPSDVVAELIVRRHANGMYSISAPTDLDVAYILISRAQEMLFARRFQDKAPQATPLILTPSLVPPRRL